jgi:hypothetical protein
MPDIASGQISLGNINTQFGYTANTQIAMATNPIALGAGSYQNNITRMSGFYYTQSGTQQGSKLVGTGGAGGSGIVILSIPIANYFGNANVTGTYTYANTGTAIVIGFTANSTYTA